MEFNSLLFPHGPSSYTLQMLAGNLIFIPKAPHFEDSPNHIPIFTGKRKEKQCLNKTTYLAKKEYIPCLYLPYHLGSNKTILYFHGNSEDLGQVFDFLIYIRSSLCINVAAIEYPSYGIYKAKECTAAQIMEDSVTAYEYFTSHVGLDQDSIILIGRSIGTGPASYLASKYDPAMLVLISGFKSVRAIVKDLAGKLFQYVVKERFENLEYIKQVSCPIMFVHGMRDSVIKYQQTVELYEYCKKAGKQCKLITPIIMTHVHLDFDMDLINPLMSFMKDCSILIKCEKNVMQSNAIRKNFALNVK